MAQIQPFPFETLKNYSAKEASLLSWLQRGLPPSGYEFILSARFNEAFRKYLGAAFSARYESIYEAAYSQFVEALPEKFVCALISLDHQPKPLLLELDDGLAAVLVDRILGGAGQSRKNPGPLTSLEEGVLQFFIVKVLQEVGNFSGILPKPRLNKILTRAASLGQLESGETRVVLLTFRLQIQSQDGYLRLVIPQELLWPLRDKVDALFEKNLMAVEPSQLKDKLRRFDEVKTVVWVEGGMVTLGADDWEQIEKGDILLLDESGVDFDGRHLGGNVMVRIGQDAPGGFKARIVQNPEALQLKVESIFQD